MDPGPACSVTTSGMHVIQLCEFTYTDYLTCINTLPSLQGLTQVEEMLVLYAWQPYKSKAPCGLYSADMF